MVDRADKEKLIDVLLVVIGLVLAGSSNQNEFFYYTVFAFLTFAITTRAWMTFRRDTIIDEIIHRIIYVVISLAMAISFPLVFVSYFYTKLNIVGWDVGIVFAFFAAITAALSAFIFTSLTEEIIDLYSTKKMVCFIVFLLLVLIADSIILAIFGISTTDGKELTDCIIQNASILINNATVTITNTTI